MPDSVVAEFTGALKEDSMDAIKRPLVVVGIASVLAAGCCSPSSFLGSANSPARRPHGCRMLRRDRRRHFSDRRTRAVRRPARARDCDQFLVQPLENLPASFIFTDSGTKWPTLEKFGTRLPSPRRSSSPRSAVSRCWRTDGAVHSAAGSRVLRSPGVMRHTRAIAPA